VGKYKVKSNINFNEITFGSLIDPRQQWHTAFAVTVEFRELSGLSAQKIQLLRDTFTRARAAHRRNNGAA
jgi:N12 class adenine-specific DNA methylase